MLDLEIESINVDPIAPGSSFGPWKGKGFSISWVMEGSGVSQYNQLKFKTSPGTVMLNKPGFTVRHNWALKHRSFQSFIVFHIKGIPKGWPPVSRWPVFKRFEEGSLIFSLWRSILEYRRPDSQISRDLLAASVELILRHYLFDKPERRTPFFVKGLPTPVERALNYLRSEYQKDPSVQIPLAATARQASVSPAHLCRAFKKCLQITPSRCLQALKIEGSAAELERSEESLKEIANRYGFSSPFHYSSAFKKAYGISPSQYRVQFRSGLTTRPPSLWFSGHELRRWGYDGPEGKIPNLKPKSAQS